MQFWNGTYERAVQQRLEVPLPGLGRAAGLGYIDTGILEAYRSKLQVARKKRCQPRRSGERSNIGDGLQIDRRVFV